MKRIALEALALQYKLSEYNILYQKILSLIENKELKPVKASGLNGKKPALYKEYWIIEKRESDAPYVEELSFLFVPAISTDYYLTHIEQYKEDRQWLFLLNEYLKKKRRRLDIPMSMNERSFDIWHREKFLKEEQGKKILKRCGIDINALNIYETTEPLAYYVHTRNTPQNMLIVENKDTFYSMRRLMTKGSDTILGTKFGTLIYGAGKGIIKSFRDFAMCCEPYMEHKENKIFYFGDLDYEGILIYEGLAKIYASKCEIEPFCEAYQKMLEDAKIIGTDNLPFTKEGQNTNIGERFLGYFHGADREAILDILENKRYIPQEILIF